MRILHVSPAYWPFIGGAQEYLQAISERLARDGHQVVIVTTDASRIECFWDPRQKRLSAGEFWLNGVRILRCPVAHLPGSPFSFLAVRRLAVELRRLKGLGDRLLEKLAPLMPLVPELERSIDALAKPFDLVHGINVAVEWPLIAAQRYARRHSLPFASTPLLHVGDTEVQRNYTMAHQVAALRNSDVVFVMTGIEREVVLELGVEPTRIYRIGAGVDPSSLQTGDVKRFRSEQGITGSIITFLGSVTYDKGAIHLVKAARLPGNIRSLYLR